MCKSITSQVQCHNQFTAMHIMNIFNEVRVKLIKSMPSTPQMHSYSRSFNVRWGIRSSLVLTTGMPLYPVHSVAGGSNTSSLAEPSQSDELLLNLFADGGVFYCHRPPYIFRWTIVVKCDLCSQPYCHFRASPVSEPILRMPCHNMCRQWSTVVVAANRINRSVRCALERTNCKESGATET